MRAFENLSSRAEISWTLPNFSPDVVFRAAAWMSSTAAAELSNVDASGGNTEAKRLIAAPKPMAT